MSTKQEGRRPSLVRRLLVLAAAMAISIGVLEGLLALLDVSFAAPRLYPGDIAMDDRDDPSLDSLVGWKLPPSTVLPETTDDYSVTYRSNSLGFRSTREFEVRPAGDLIAFLGDSYTFGSGVADDETFAALLEAELEGTIIYNFGIGAFGIDQMLLTLEHYALPLKPRLVVVCFIRNDLERSMNSYRKDIVWLSKPAFTLEDGELTLLTHENRPPALWRAFEKHSRLWAFWRRLEISLGKDYAIGAQWRLNRALFERMRNATEAAGASFVLVHIPVNRRSPTPLYDREFAKMGFDYLDLRPLLPEDADALYYENDHHLNAAGHRFAAEAIHAFLIEHGLANTTPR